jgi:hypothetical protein
MGQIRIEMLMQYTTRQSNINSYADIFIRNNASHNLRNKSDRLSFFSKFKEQMKYLYILPVFSFVE